jgi:beta-galactosidase
MNIHFGVDYYPEHWPRERWETDARLMQEMGVQVVRLAEFSWHKLEPEEGTYEFAWLDDAVALLGRYGIKTVMGTPSAAPPAWMINKHPEILPVDKNGVRRSFGGRHHDCQSQPVYRDYVTKIVTAMAKHFCNNPDVVGWQPDNEIGSGHQDNMCTCDSCRSSFQAWLEQKYGTVEALNHAWGTAFWSQEYNSFAEVFTPRATVVGENPSAMLDWKLFTSDLVVDFMKNQTDILRKYCPKQFITHNYMGFADTVDYYKLGELLDFVSHDQYPGGFFGVQPHAENAQLAATLDVVRSYKNKPFWIMEQQSGITGWQILGRAPAPGQLTAWALQSVAHGADAIVYFRWRVCAVGTEQYWHGILPHSGIPGRRYAELKDTAHSMLPIMEKLQGSMPRADVGIVFSFRQDYALSLQPQHPELSYPGQILKYYKALYARNITTDFVPENGDFGRYKLLIAPLQYLMDPELEEKYFRYVQNGGHLVLTMRTGVKDANDLCMTDRELPGRLADLTGIEVLDYDCLRDVEVKIHFGSADYTGRLWADLMRVQKSVKVLGTYASEFYTGEPCITQNAYGSGLCYYVGTEPDEALMAALMAELTTDAGVSSLGVSDTGVELAARENADTRWVFAINHTEKPAVFQVPAGAVVLRGQTPGLLNPFEVQLFELQK